MSKKDIDTKGPAINYAESVRELFKRDPDIKIYFNDRTLTMIMEVKNPLKRLALRELLPEVKLINGKEKVYINIKQANRVGGDKYIPEIIDAAFSGNPLYCYKHTWNDGSMSNPMTWLEFAKEVIQYPADDLHSLYGDRSVMPAQLAEEIIGEKTDYCFYDTINPERDPVPDDRGPFGKEK